LVDDAGARVAGSLNATVPGKPGFEEFLPYGTQGQGGVAQALTTKVPGGTLVVAADRADLDAIDQTLASLFAGSLAAMLAQGLGAAFLIGWVTRRRLSRIDATAQAIIGGDLTHRIPRDNSGSEFDRLASTLNRMLDRIEGLMENLRQVSSDVAHDLRTPLTRLHNKLDEAMREPDTEVHSRLLDDAQAQATDLLELFAALLRLAEIEGLSDRLPLRRVDLSELLERMSESYRPDIEDSGRTLEVDIAERLQIEGDHRLISQAIANLLDNTLRHTTNGTKIRLTAARFAKYIEVAVADDGPGVDAETAPRLFERFARSEQARSSPGHGLGLSMVRAIAQAHGGQAELSLGEKGFRVVVRYPLAPC
jgi:signal transduction histidine kinase